MLQKLLQFLFFLLAGSFCANAQDTLVQWGGQKTPVFITGMDPFKVRYKRPSNPTREFSIDKEKIMHIRSADSTKDWEALVYGQNAYGPLPHTAKGIDSLAREHVLKYYQGHHVVGSKTFWAGLLGTPLLGIPYAMHHAVDKIEENNLGMMGNPYHKNPDYLNSYIDHAREQNRKRIFANMVVGSIVCSIPLSIVVFFASGGF